MNTFGEYILMREAQATLPDPAKPDDIDEETWASTDSNWKHMWVVASPYMKKILLNQVQGVAHQASQGIAQQPTTYRVQQQRQIMPSRAAKALGPIQGQTGQGLESIRAGGRVPPHLVSQIPPGDIAPGWETATKFYKGRDGQVYKK